MFIFVSFYNLFENVTCSFMIEFWVWRVDWKQWVFINCPKSIILQVNLEALFSFLILMFSHQSQLISAFFTFLFCSMPQFFLWLLLFLQRRNFALNLLFFLTFWWTETAVKTNHKLLSFILTSVFFVALLFPIRNIFILILLEK